MRNAVALRQFRLGRADVKAAIKLRRITSQYLAAELGGQPHAERGLPRCRGANDDNERKFRCARIHRNRICQAETSYAMSTIRRDRDWREPAGGKTSLIGVFDRQIVQKHDADLDERTMETRRQWFKGIGGTNGGDGRTIQRLFSRTH